MYHIICVLYFVWVRGSCISFRQRKTNYSISANTRSEVTSSNLVVFCGCICVYRFSRVKRSVRWPCFYTTWFGSVWGCGGKYVLISNLPLKCRLLVSLLLYPLSFQLWDSSSLYYVFICCVNGSIFRKSFNKFQVPLKCDKKNRYCRL